MSAYDEGMEAAKNRIRFSEGPYGYSACMKRNEEFSMERFEEWAKGWSAQLDAEGLNMRFRPKRKPRLPAAQQPEGKS